jgi:tetratricopeptide (TPR) repeat protein
LAYRWLGISYSDADPVRYLAFSEKAYFVDPLDLGIHRHIAIALTRLGRYKEALVVTRDRLNLDPNNSNVYEQASFIHLQSGHLDRTLKSFYLAYRMTPEDYYGAQALTVLIGLGECELAEAWQRDMQTRGISDAHQETRLPFLCGRPEQALDVMKKAFEQGGVMLIDLAVAYIRVSRDYRKARQAYERVFSQWDKEPGFIPEIWPLFIDYALVLQHTGDSKKAAELIGEILAVLESQLAIGVAIGDRALHLQDHVAKLHAMNGDIKKAMTALRHAASQGGLSCVPCLRKQPFYDNLRDEEAFAMLVAEQQEINTAQRQKLVNENLLLKPEELLRLESFVHNPFTDD